MTEWLFWVLLAFLAGTVVYMLGHAAVQTLQCCIGG